jgi:hypothetical protein
MQEESKQVTGFSVPTSRRPEFDAALLKLKLRRPFDSKSQLIVDAVLAAAATLDKEAQEEEQPANKRRPVLAQA